MVIGAEYRICEGINGVPMVTVLGVIDESTIRVFCDVLEVAETRSARGLIVDLEQATVLSHTALETLAEINTRFIAGSRPLIVVSAGEHATGVVIPLTAAQIQTFPTLVAALHAVRTQSSQTGASPVSA